MPNHNGQACEQLIQQIITHTDRRKDFTDELWVEVNLHMLECTHADFFFHFINWMEIVQKEADTERYAQLMRRCPDYNEEMDHDRRRDEILARVRILENNFNDSDFGRTWAAVYALQSDSANDSLGIEREALADMVSARLLMTSGDPRHAAIALDTSRDAYRLSKQFGPEYKVWARNIERVHAMVLWKNKRYFEMRRPLIGAVITTIRYRLGAG